MTGSEARTPRKAAVLPHRRHVVATDGRGVGPRRWQARGRQRDRNARTRAIKKPLTPGTCPPKSAWAAPSSVAVQCSRRGLSGSHRLSASAIPTNATWKLSICLSFFALAAGAGSINPPGPIGPWPRLPTYNHPTHRQHGRPRAIDSIRHANANRVDDCVSVGVSVESSRPGTGASVRFDGTPGRATL
jgi:hypothetical protein